MLVAQNGHMKQFQTRTYHSKMSTRVRHEKLLCNNTPTVIQN